MRELFVKYRLVIRFILTFTIVYGSLTFLYKFYLDFSDGSQYYPDFFTNSVAKQTKEVLNAAGYDAYVNAHPNEPSMKVIVSGKFVARVIEGCNSISIIILFLSFIIAFSGRIKSTLLYILTGSTFIYIVNLIRIAVISIALYHYPAHQEVLHSVVFPGIIYGLVFILWIIWVNRFSTIKNKVNG